MSTTEESPVPALDVERAVRERYSAASAHRERELCCPVDYDPALLKALPAEILERDYGCGDPSRFVREGDTVLDLGSGGGKICYMAAQLAGPAGRVIGVDMNLDMLALARKYQDEMARKIGAPNVEFRRGRIQDLRLDLDRVDIWLAAHPVRDAEGWAELEAHSRELREREPMIADASVDVVVSNCVLNLVREEDRRALFAEIFRVLKRGGRAAISDIVSDEVVPGDLRQDPELWSGCISGAFTEAGLLEAFEEAGFHGMSLARRDETPWRTVRGIEFRSVTVVAWKGKQGPCMERRQAVIYKGPWKYVLDDDGHRLERGQRMAVCDKTFQLFTQGPYQDQVIPVLPIEEVPLEGAAAFACHKNAVRSPRETKGLDYDATTEAGDCCGPDGCC